MSHLTNQSGLILPGSGIGPVHVSGTGAPPAPIATSEPREDSPWAVPREKLPQIARLMRARAQMSAEEILALSSRGAARGQRVAAGAVAVLSIRGLITPRGSILSQLFGAGPSGLEAFRQNFHEAIGDNDIGAIVMDIDSPGGLTDLVTETAREIRAARGAKPIIAVANAMAASAAYYLASQADEVVVTPSGRLGSIGVFVVHDDWSKFNEDMGVMPTYISAGKYKTDGNPDEPLSDTARSAFQQQVDELYDLFVADVAAGRGVPESTVRDGYGEGRCLQARAALSAGLADRIETLEEAISRAARGEVSATTARAATQPAAPAAADMSLEEQNSMLEQQLAAQEKIGTATQLFSPALTSAAPTPAPEAAPASTPEQRMRVIDVLLG